MAVATKVHAEDGSPRAELAALERPILAAGLVLVTLHLLALSLAGPDTTTLGLFAIAALPAAWFAVQPHVTRATRFALALALGCLRSGSASCPTASLSANRPNRRDRVRSALAARV